MPDSRLTANAALDAIARAGDGDYGVLLEHGTLEVGFYKPDKIDPQQPRPEGVGLKTRFRHYLNLDRTYDRLQRLLGDFQWGTMEEIFLAGREQL